MENENQNVQENVQNTETPEVKLPTTAEEFNKMLQSETDKRVTQALQTAKSKWEQEYNSKLEVEKREAARLAKLTAAEREAEKFKLEKEKFESERKQFETQKLEMEIIKQLSADGLPTIFSKHLLADDAEGVMENIKEFKEVWQQEIQKAVQGRLVKTKVPGTANKETTANTTTSSFVNTLKENRIRR